MAFAAVFISAPAYPVRVVQNCVVQVLEESLLEVKTPLSESDLGKIRGVFKSSAISTQEKARRAFEITLDARLKSVSAEDATLIRNAYRDLKRSYSDRELNGAVSDGIVSVTLPKAYAGTMIEYHVVSHELEHVLQKLKVGSRVKELRKTVLDVRHTGKIIFFEEEGAMRAEWAYLNSIPESARKEMAEEITRDPRIDRSLKRFLITNVLEARHDAETYLSIQRSGGRYSKFDSALTAAHGRMREVMVDVSENKALMGALGVSVIVAACNAITDENGRLPKTQFATKVCSKLR